jgi:hypothetical protein
LRGRNTKSSQIKKLASVRARRVFVVDPQRLEGYKLIAKRKPRLPLAGFLLVQARVRPRLTAFERPLLYMPSCFCLRGAPASVAASGPQYLCKADAESVCKRREVLERHSP